MNDKQSINKNRCTYMHIRLSDGIIFYVGKGTEKRAKSVFNRNKNWHKVVREHGFRHEILAFFDTHEEAYDHEKFLIQCFREMKFPLTNISDGGKGRTGAGKPHTEAHKKMMSERYKGSGNPMYGKKHTNDALKKIQIASTRPSSMSEEAKKRLSDQRKGVPRPESVKEKVRASKLGKKMSDSARENMSKAHKARFERMKIEKQ